MKHIQIIYKQRTPQHDASMRQRKFQSPQKELNPGPPRQKTPRPAGQLCQTQTFKIFGNCSYAAICHAAFNASASSDNLLTAIN